MTPALVLAEIIEIYRSSKKKKDINWWTEWVCRPPAAVVVYLLQNTRITPNQVTFLSFLVACGSGVMFALLPGHLWLIAAAVVFEFSFVLDCADGQLSRVRGTSSVIGHLLDFLMDEIKAMFMFACITFRLWYFGGDVNFLLIGLAALFCLASGLSLTSFTRRPEYGAKPPTKDGQPVEVKRRRGPLGLAITGLEHAARVVVHYPSYIWLCAAFDRIDIYFYAYAVVNGLYLARISLAVLLKLGRFAPREVPT